MNMNAFTKNHPECKPDEIYLGNISDSEAAKLQWKTKRWGFVAYRIDGSPIGNQREGTGFVRPWFVNEAEWRAAGSVPDEEPKPDDK